MSLWSIILSCGIILMNTVCESYGTTETCQVKNVLFVPYKQQISSGFCSPTEVVEAGKLKLCFNIHTQNGSTGRCDNNEFNCNITAYYYNTTSSFIMNKKIFSQQDIVLFGADQGFECFPSDFHETNGSFFNIHKCLNKDVLYHRLNKTGCCENNCHDYKFTVDHKAETVDCVPHEPPGQHQRPDPTPAPTPDPTPAPTPDPTPAPTPDPTPETNNSPENSLDVALDVIKNISFMVEHMDYGETEDIQRDKIRGLIHKLPYRNQTNIYIGITERNISINRHSTNPGTGPSLLVHVPKEASEMALERNGSYVGVFLIPDVHWSISGSYFLDNKTVGIEMGAEISNLSQPIYIEFNNVDKKENTASCRSWDGQGKEPTWVPDGCLTNEAGDSIICQCSHLTFFAVLMSPPSGNITSSDLSSLTYITSVGCGVSLFFLAVGIFMHSLIRKRKASQGTQILMNLFVAMFTLNLSFLTNDKIANLGNVVACVAIAACMHYMMLATLTWFFMQALHLYLTLWGHPSEIKRYMLKICIMGWVTPSVIVIPLLALKKYDYLVISADDGTSAKMCWIPNASVQQGVNIGYYSIVFIFTSSIFILTVRQIVCLLPSKAKAGTDGSSIKSNSVSILGLFLLLGITWAFAFFSYGPLLKASYYIFTILNSFHGFFLFIYYYNSRKHDVEKSIASGSSSTVASNTVSTSFYQ